MMTGATARQRRLFFEDILLHRVPTRAAKFHRPTHAAPAALVQATLPQQVVLPAQLVPVEHLVADLGGKLFAQETAHLLPERLFLVGKFKAHARYRTSWAWTPLSSALQNLIPN
jgi:hypothetical protein